MAGQIKRWTIIPTGILPLFVFIFFFTFLWLEFCGFSTLFVRTMINLQSIATNNNVINIIKLKGYYFLITCQQQLFPYQLFQKCSLQIVQEVDCWTFFDDCIKRYCMVGHMYNRVFSIRGEGLPMTVYILITPAI